MSTHNLYCYSYRRSFPFFDGTNTLAESNPLSLSLPLSCMMHQREGGWMNGDETGKITFSGEEKSQEFTSNK